jgi:hypothetical protein
MGESDWGLCKDCKWWQIEPDDFFLASRRGESLDSVDNSD